MSKSAKQEIASLTLLATVSLALVAPASAADWKGTEATVDGVVHMKNPAEPMIGKVTMELEELWRIGGDTDDEDEFFGVITQVTNDDDGNVYLLDSQLNEVKIFDKDGAFVRTIGREGEGPGEFRFPSSVFFVPTGEVGVLQTAPAKIVLLTKDGEPAGEMPTPKIEGEGFVSMSGARLAGDQLVCMAQANNFNQEAGTFTQTVMLRGANTKGDIVATYYSEPRLWEFANPVIDEMKWDTIQNRWAVSPDGKVWGCPKHSEYEIHLWNPDGSLAKVITTEHSPHKRTEDEMNRVKSVWEVFTRQAPNSTLKMQDYDKSIASIFTRDDGSLWVMNSKGARPTEAGVMGTFDVYDPQGRFVKQVSFKGDGDPRDDFFFFVQDRLYVVTDFLNALVAMQGGMSGDEEAEDAEPMAVICYQLDVDKLAMN